MPLSTRDERVFTHRGPGAGGPCEPCELFIMTPVADDGWKGLLHHTYQRFQQAIVVCIPPHLFRKRSSYRSKNPDFPVAVSR